MVLELLVIAPVTGPELDGAGVIGCRVTANLQNFKPGPVRFPGPPGGASLIIVIALSWVQGFQQVGHFLVRKG